MGRAVRRGTGPWLRGLRQQRPQGDGLRSPDALRYGSAALTRYHHEAGAEQGALCEIERLTFFKSLENFDHPRNMRSLPRAWRPPPNCARSSSWVRMRCRATSLQNLPPYRPKWHLPPARSLPSTALYPTAAEYEHKKSRRNAGLFASATGVLQFAAVYWNRANNSTGGAFLLWYR